MIAGPAPREARKSKLVNWGGGLKDKPANNMLAPPQLTSLLFNSLIIVRVVNF